jgi:hypothetical protein
LQANVGARHKYFNEEKTTTEFMKKYYTLLGLPISIIDNNISTNIGVRRPSQNEITQTYERSGIKIESIEPIGSLWVCVKGRA